MRKYAFPTCVPLPFLSVLARFSFTFMPHGKARSCSVLKSGKGASRSKSLDLLATTNCRSGYRQMPFGLPANAIRSTGKCRSVTSNGVRNAFTQGCMETGRLKCFKNSECVFPESGTIQPMGDADGGNKNTLALRVRSANIHRQRTPQERATLILQVLDFCPIREGGGKVGRGGEAFFLPSVQLTDNVATTGCELFLRIVVGAL